MQNTTNKAVRYSGDPTVDAMWMGADQEIYELDDPYEDTIPEDISDDKN